MRKIRRRLIPLLWDGTGPEGSGRIFRSGAGNTGSDAGRKSVPETADRGTDYAKKLEGPIKMILETIQTYNDVKKVPMEQMPQLAQEIRDFLIHTLSRTGGHLASNLGAVELTMALHYVFDLPEDKLIWDVGHQAYTHKILTGRQKGFDNLRKLGGMSGFPKREEIPCDSFDTGSPVSLLFPQDWAM